MVKVRISVEKYSSGPKGMAILFQSPDSTTDSHEKYYGNERPQCRLSKSELQLIKVELPANHSCSFTIRLKEAYTKVWDAKWMNQLTTNGGSPDAPKYFSFERTVFLKPIADDDVSFTGTGQRNPCTTFIVQLFAVNGIISNEVPGH
ncbi:unnamed protein product [Fasciola hepatica]|uniref:Uncharacterized protein n=1 Tax=Fasciola hepatica TaxID=6192 RepID=A0ABC9HFT0_FASHE